MHVSVLLFLLLFKQSDLFVMNAFVFFHLSSRLAVIYCRGTSSHFKQISRYSSLKISQYNVTVQDHTFSQSFSMTTPSQIFKIIHGDKTYVESGVLQSPQAILVITSVFFTSYALSDT